MKKWIACIWLVVYTCVSTGFAVSTHYCMNEPRSVEFGAVKENTCDKCGMPKKESNGCCRDEVKVVKLQQDTQLAKLLLPSFSLAMPTAVVPDYLPAPFYNFKKSGVATAFESPPLPQKDQYITNCVFRI